MHRSASWRALALAPVVVVLSACGGGGASGPTALRVRDAVVVAGTTPGTATVTMSITASRDDSLTGVGMLEPAVARARLVVLGGASGGDGHLGHLDPKGSEPHSHARALALPGGRAVRLTSNGSRITLSGLPEGAAGPVRLRLFLAGGTTETVDARPAPG